MQYVVYVSRYMHKLGHIVVIELELFYGEKMLNVLDVTGKEIVHTNNLVTFFKEAEDMPAYAMVQMVDTSIAPPTGTFTAGAGADMPRSVNAKTNRR